MRTDANLFPIPPTIRDLGLLVARVVLGVIFMAHGWQKFADWGLVGTAENFEQMQIPAPSVSAVFAAGVELVGGALLIVGLLTPIVGVLAALVMAGATFFVHLPNGVFVDQGGWELVAALGVGALMLAVVGPGRISLDALFTRGSRRQAATPSQPAAGEDHAAAGQRGEPVQVDR